MIVYLITSILNQKMYVGQTNRTWKDRWAEHVYDSKVKRYESRLHNAIAKYGPDAFTCIVLARDLSSEAADKLEISLIRFLATSDKKTGYNIALGGGGRNACMRPEAVAKMAATKIENKNCTGRVMSQETKNKIRNALLDRPGPKWSSERKAAFSAARKGCIFSQATRDKMSIAQKKRFAKRPELPSAEATV